MTIVKLVIAALLLVVLVPYLQNVLSVFVLLPSSLIAVFSLIVVIGFIKWIVGD